MLISLTYHSRTCGTWLKRTGIALGAKLIPSPTRNRDRRKVRKMGIMTLAYEPIPEITYPTKTSSSTQHRFLVVSFTLCFPLKLL